MVFGYIFRLIGALLLLIQHDEAQILQGGKHSGAGANHHPGLPRLDALPLVVPLPCSQGGVEDGHLLPEMGGEQPHKLGSQGDLGHQHQGGAAPPERLVDQFQIDLGFSAAGDAVEQSGGGLVLGGQGVEAVKGGLLLVVEHRLGQPLHLLHLHPAVDLPFFQGDDPALDQSAEGGRAGPGEIAQFLGGGFPNGAQQLHHCVLHGGGPPPGGGLIQGLLGRNGQGGHLLGLVPHPPLGAGLQGDDPLVPQQLEGGIGVLCAEGLPDGGHVGAAAVGKKQLHHLPGVVRPAGGLKGRRPVHSGGNLPLVLESVVQPRRQHGPGGVIHGAEPPLPHPQSQADGLPVQHRAIVQHGEHRLEGIAVPVLQGQHNTLGAAVARPKGDDHPHTGPQYRGQRGGHGVVVGLVDGVGGGLEGDFCYHVRALPTTSPKDSPRQATGRKVCRLPLIPLISGLFLAQLHLALGHLTDGDGNGLVVQRNPGVLRLGGHLTGPLGHNIHQHIAAGHLLQQFIHRGFQHHI